MTKHPAALAILLLLILSPISFIAELERGKEDEREMVCYER